MSKLNICINVQFYLHDLHIIIRLLIICYIILYRLKIYYFSHTFKFKKKKGFTSLLFSSVGDCYCLFHYY